MQTYSSKLTPPFSQVSLRTATWSLSTGSLHCSAAVQSMEWYLCPEEFKRKDNVRPLVVLFGWLLAKSRHLHKYGELYHQHGADVITLKIEAMEVINPLTPRVKPWLIQSELHDLCLQLTALLKRTLVLNPLTPKVKPWVIQSFLTFVSMHRTLMCDHSLKSC